MQEGKKVRLTYIDTVCPPCLLNTGTHILTSFENTPHSKYQRNISEVSKNTMKSLKFLQSLQNSYKISEIWNTTKSLSTSLPSHSSLICIQPCMFITPTILSTSYISLVHIRVILHN